MARLKSMMIAGVVAMTAGIANANTYVWEWNAGDPGAYGLNNVAGTYESVEAEYHSLSGIFRWTVTFSDQVTEGITFAVNDGPNPKGHAGELALVYVDATNMGDVRTSLYAYNGKNLINSHKDGDGNVGGNQTPDRLMSVFDTTGGINSVSVSDVGSKRVFEINLDVSGVNAHSPLYPGSSPWTGLQFDSSLGLWMHSFTGLSTGYGNTEGNDNFGYLTQWNLGQQSTHGWFDGTGFETRIIPLPTAAGMGFVGLAGLAARRRR